jgi:hypothetical protein
MFWSWNLVEELANYVCFGILIVLRLEEREAQRRCAVRLIH